MKKIRILLTLLFIFCYFSILSQKPWKNNNRFLLDNLKNYPNIDSGVVYYRIPLNIVIYKFPEFPLYYNYANVKKIIYLLNNYYYKNTGIAFYIQEIKTVNKPQYLKSQFIRELPWVITSNKEKYAIDVYYLQKIETNFIFKKLYSNGVYFYLIESIVVDANAHSSTLAHELGHFLGLDHPHKNWNGGKLLQESVDRNQKSGIFKKRINCQVRGDLLEDTPAEPDLRKFTDKNCNYSGNIKDAWGKVYQPHTDNIMSYLKNLDCRRNFTLMQKSVMLYTISKHKFANVYKVTPKTKHFDFDEYEPDDNIFQASLLKINDIQKHTFHTVPATNKDGYIPNQYDYFILPKIDNNLQLSIKIDSVNKFVYKITILDAFYNKYYETTSYADCQITLLPEYSNSYVCIELVSMPTAGRIFEYQIEIVRYNEN